MSQRMTKRTLAPMRTDKLNVLTYNIASGIKNESEENITIRMRVIAKMLLDADHLPDIISLLDVTVLGYQTLYKYLVAKYIVFQVFIDEKDKSGEVLLCLRETTEIPEGCQPYYYDLTTGKGRVVGTELFLKTLDININVLLTKLQNEAQFPLILQVAQPLSNVLLIGDFLLDKEFDHDFSDAWITMGCPSYLREHRLARVLYATGLELTIERLTLLGTQVIKKTNEAPSAHLGLLATFQKKV
jgi:hypothetical protein